MMPNVMSNTTDLHKLYKKMIAEAVDECTDTDLLDLVWKLLIHELSGTNKD